MLPLCGDKFLLFSKLQTKKLSQNFITINNLKFPETVTKPMIGPELKRDLFALLSNITYIVQINGDNMKQRSGETILHLTAFKQKNYSKIMQIPMSEQRSFLLDDMYHLQSQCSDKRL
jgi:hypothetical protein